jgi:hypothetical protein
MNPAESVLLDTSIIVAHFRREPALAERLKSATLYVPLPVLGELYYGLQVWEPGQDSVDRRYCKGTPIAFSYPRSALLTSKRLESLGMVA